MFYHTLIGKSGYTPAEDLKPILLWENPSPTSEFKSQTISLNLTDYAGVLVEYARNVTLNDVISRVYVKKEDYDIVGFGAGNGGGYGSASSAAGRGVKVDDNGVIFDSGYTTAESNTSCIPVKIYGVKKYVVGSNEVLKQVTTVAGTNTIELGFKPRILILTLTSQIVYVDTDKDSNNQYVYGISNLGGTPASYKLEYGTNTIGLIIGLTDVGFQFGINSNQQVLICAIE